MIRQSYNLAGVYNFGNRIFTNLPGLFIYDITFWDSNGVFGANFSVDVTVDDRPFMSNVSGPLVVEENSTGIFINWSLGDSSGGGNYTILINGTVYSSYFNQNWTNGTMVSVNVNTSILGSYNYTIVFQDYYGYSGFNDSFIIFIDIVSISMS